MKTRKEGTLTKAREIKPPEGKGAKKSTEKDTDTDSAESAILLLATMIHPCAQKTNTRMYHLLSLSLRRATTTGSS